MLVKQVRRLLSNLPLSVRQTLGEWLPRSLLNWYKHWATDVYVISFPKCGRTWLKVMMGRALATHFGLRDANVLEISEFSARDPQIPCIRFTHDDSPHQRCPHELQADKSLYVRHKVIFLVRDPKDVAVSLYFQKTRRDFEYDGSLEEFIREERGSVDSLLRFYDIWEKNRHLPRAFLVVRYEDLHSRQENELKKVLAFIGVNGISDEVIQEAVKFGSFDNMRRMETEGRFDLESLRPRDRSDYESYKTRRGEIGAFKMYLRPEEIVDLDRRIAEKLSDFYLPYKQ